MKTVIYLALLCIISLPAVQAQKPITINDDSYKFGNTMCPGIWVDIPEANLETVQKAWIKVLEKGTKSNVLQTGSEITIFGAMMKDISEVPVNIFSEIHGEDSVVRLFAAVELTRDEFTAIDSKEHEQLKKTVKHFAREQYLKVAEVQLSTEESTLRDLEKDLASLRRNKEKHEKDIQWANTTISEENYKITAVKKEMVNTDASLEARSAELSSMAEGDAKKAKQSEIKALQKKKKDHLKDVSASENKISKANATLVDSNNAIPQNIKQQEEQVLKINAQKLVVNKFTGKLNTIKSY